MSAEQEAIQARKEVNDHQAQNQKEQEALRKAFNADGQLKMGWMREILSLEDMENTLEEYELKKIRGLVNKQWMLSNLSDAQTHDREHKLAVMKLKILGEFPPEESQIQDELRAFLYDDKYEKLGALTPEKRNAVDQIILSLQNLVNRSTGGFERKQINTNIARTESENDTGQESSGGRFSFFG